MRVFRKFSSFSSIDYLILFLTVTGLNLRSILENLLPNVALPFWAYLLISITLVLIAVFTVSEEKNSHSLTEGSDEEADFFYDWYNKRGELIVFCRDLEWLENARFDKVVRVLETKAKKEGLKLYLRRTKNKIVTRLEKAGAELFKVKPNIRSEHKFSILDENGFKSIIIRDRPVSKSTSHVEEYLNNPALVNLAMDMLDKVVQN